MHLKGPYIHKLLILTAVDRFRSTAKVVSQETGHHPFEHNRKKSLDYFVIVSARRYARFGLHLEVGTTCSILIGRRERCVS